MEISLNEYRLLSPSDVIMETDMMTATENPGTEGYLEVWDCLPECTGRLVGCEHRFRFARKKTEETSMSKFKAGDRVKVEGYGYGWDGEAVLDSKNSLFQGHWNLIHAQNGLGAIPETFLVSTDSWRKLAPTEDTEEGDEARGNGKVFVADDCGYFDDAFDFADSYCMRKLGFEIHRKVKPIDPSNTPPDEQLWGAVWYDACEYVQTGNVGDQDIEAEHTLLEEEAAERGYGDAWW